MSDWQFQSVLSGIYGDISVSSRNVVGTPLVLATAKTDLASGAFPTPPGVFRFTLATTNTLTVQALDAVDYKSPALFTGSKTVNCDGAYENLHVLPGITIVLSADRSTGDVFEIGIGCVYNPTYSVWERTAAMGFCVAGITGKTVDIRVKNVGTLTQSNCFFIATNAIRLVNVTSEIRPFMSFRQVGVLNPTTDATGKSITFTDFTSGTPNTASILVDGNPIDILDVTNGVLIPDGVDLSCDGTTIYRFADGTDYQSGEFILSGSLASTDTATIYVSDGGDMIQVTDEDGIFVAGTDGAYITEQNAGEGVITAGGYADVALRLNPASGVTPDANQRQISIRVSSIGI